MSTRVLCLLAAAAALTALPVLGGETIWVRAYTSVSEADVGALLNWMQWAKHIDSYRRTTDEAGGFAFIFAFDDHEAALFVNYPVVGSGSGEVLYQSLMLYTYFGMESPPALSAINNWNQQYWYSRAYLDEEGDPCQQSVLSLVGGVAEGAIKNWVLLFLKSLSVFADYIGFAPGTPTTQPIPGP